MYARFLQATSLTASKASRKQRARRTNPVTAATAKRKAAGAAKKTRTKDKEAGCFYYLGLICTAKLSCAEVSSVKSAKAKSSSASAESSCGSQMSRWHHTSPTRSSRRQPRRSQSQPTHLRRRHQRCLAFCIQINEIVYFYSKRRSTSWHSHSEYSEYSYRRTKSTTPTPRYESRRRQERKRNHRLGIFVLRAAHRSPCV